jgi:uncharacterized protein (TIGR02271 family)
MASIRDLTSDLSKMFKDHISTTNDSTESKTRTLGVESAGEIELIAEALHIDKKRIAEGSVVVRKEVITEIQTIQVPVQREEIVIERKDAEGHTVELVRGLTELRIPVAHEEVVVTKQPHVAEKLRIMKRTVEHTETFETELSHEDIKIDVDDSAA